MYVYFTVYLVKAGLEMWELGPSFYHVVLRCKHWTSLLTGLLLCTEPLCCPEKVWLLCWAPSELSPVNSVFSVCSLWTFPLSEARMQKGLLLQCANHFPDEDFESHLSIWMELKQVKMYEQISEKRNVQNRSSCVRWLGLPKDVKVWPKELWNAESRRVSETMEYSEQPETHWCFYLQLLMGGLFWPAPNMMISNFSYLDKYQM